MTRDSEIVRCEVCQVLIPRDRVIHRQTLPGIWFCRKQDAEPAEYIDECPICHRLGAMEPLAQSEAERPLGEAMMGMIPD